MNGQDIQQTTAEKELAEGGYDAVVLFRSEFAQVLLLEDQKTIICEATSSYIPIDRFKEVFNTITPSVKDHGVNKIIFDKRSLNTFHQPSMEWYFVVWKKELYELGLTTHRKILPTLMPWFKQAVAAGRKRIEEKFNYDYLDKLDIQYRDSIAEAVED